MGKSDGPWVSLAEIDVPTNSVCLDSSFNDVFQNMNYSAWNGTETANFPPLAQFNESVDALFSQDVTAIPVHTTETLGGRFTEHSPLLWYQRNTTDSDLHVDVNNTNKIVAWEDYTKESGASFYRRDTFDRQIGNDAIQIRNNPGSGIDWCIICLLYTSPSPRDRTRSRMPSSA